VGSRGGARVDFFSFHNTIAIVLLRSKLKSQIQFDAQPGVL